MADHSGGWSRKALVISATALLALLAFGTTTQPWLDAEVQGAAARAAQVQVQGSKAAPAVSALALVSLAGVLAAAVAGRIGRIVASLVVLLAGAGVAASAAFVLADPRAAADGSIASATGLSGGEASISLSVFPSLAVAAGLLIVMCGAWAFAASRGWTLRTKYDSAGSAGAMGQGGGSTEPVDEIDGWDQLSKGEDPTR